MKARVIGVVADPVRIARAVTSQFNDVALLHSGCGGVSFVAGGRRTRLSHGLDPHEPGNTGPFEDVPHWIGVIPYESRRALERPGWRVVDRRGAPAMASPQWRRYPAVTRIDPARGEVIVIGDDDAAVGRLAKAVASEPEVRSATCVLDEVPDGEAHLRRVARARELILDGDMYQVSLAHRYGFSFAGDAVALYARATKHRPCRFGAVLSLPDATVVSLSPELLLHAQVKNERFVAA